MLPNLGSRIVPLVALVALLPQPASSQTTLHSLQVYGTWDVRSLGDVDGDGVADFGVGCPGTSQLYCNSGSGVVHIYSGLTGAELYSKNAPLGGVPVDAFGWSIDGVGDVNGDGLSDFVVGAPLWASSTFQCGEGRAYICSGLDGAILQTLVAPGNVPGAYQAFGRSVAGVGDVNADGVPDVAVGSEYGFNALGVQSGNVGIYSGLDGSILHTLDGNWINERFGTCCAAAGDVNSDGYADVIVGSPYGNYASGLGGVRVYSGFDGLLIKFTTGTFSDAIGYGVASVGDINGDGVPDFITGTANEARVYSGQTLTLIRTLPAQPTFPIGSVPYPFPHPVSGIADVDGDGVRDIVTATTAGASVYSGLTGTLILTHPMPTGVASVGSATDLNGDGYADVLCGTWNGATTRADVVLAHCPVPTTFCTAKLNSVGCLPSMSSSGVLSLSVGNDDFYALASNELNNVNGMLIWSSNPASVPFYGGTLCVGPGIHRTPVQNSGGSPTGVDCSGGYSFNFSRAYVLGYAVQPGQRLYAQCWSRDPGYSPPYNVGLTNGLSFTVCP